MTLTTITEEDYARVAAVVRDQLASGERVGNTSVRKLTGLNYDQAIRFFNLAIQRGFLERKGVGAQIHYLLGPEAEI